MWLNSNFWSLFSILVCLQLFHQFDTSKSAIISKPTLKSESKEKSVPTRNSTTTTWAPFIPNTRILKDKIISTYEPFAVHSLGLYNYYDEHQFIVTAPTSDGIIMVVQYIFMGNETGSISNGTCSDFIQVTQANVNFPKICGEVKVGDNSSTPSGLIGPRTLVFSGKQITVNIKHHLLDHYHYNISGKLVFTGFRFTRELRCGVGKKSCSIDSGNRFGVPAYENQICIPRSLFCDRDYNCGNTSGNDSFGYDERSCGSLIKNWIPFSSGSVTQRPSETGVLPSMVPVIHQSPTYPYNRLNKPIDRSYNSPDEPNNVLMWLVGGFGALAIIIGLTSLFICKKESDQRVRPNSTQPEQLRRAEVEQNDQDSLVSFFRHQTLVDIAPFNYEPDSNLVMDERPPTYQECMRAEAGFSVPEPYVDC